MTLAYSFLVGLFITVFAIAVLAKAAGAIGAIDHPGPRKIHDAPIPRIGGVAIAISAWSAILLLLPLTQQVLAFLAGSLVIVAVGVWDDVRSLNYKVKILSQTIGIVILLWGGVQFSQLPFFGIESVPAYIAYPIAFLFLFGVTNASNLFDGLDGLAGGCLALSVGAVSLLAILAGDAFAPVVGLALIGGALGFLRYNTHPAMIFMGDAGSQFLGFTAGFLSIYLITEANRALSPALPFLILGLPLIDTFSVTVRRLLQRRSPFIGDRQHLHHRLLARGLTHAQTVSVLYLIQLTMVIAAFVIRYQSDFMILGLIGLFGLCVFAPLYWLESANVAVSQVSNGRIRAHRSRGFLVRRLAAIASHGRFAAACLIVLFFVLGTAFIRMPTQDIAIMCMIVAAVSALGMFVFKAWHVLFVRLSAYVAALAFCYLMSKGGAQASIWVNWPTNGYLALLGGLVILSIVFSPDNAFTFSPQDLLMMVMVIIVPGLDVWRSFDFPIGTLILQVSILFYAIEYVMTGPRRIRGVVPLASTFALLAIGAIGFS